MTQQNSESQQEKPPYVLSLDVGTSSTRALLFDAAGNSLLGIESQHTYSLTTSERGEVSVDADTLLQVVVQTIDETLQAAGERAQQIVAVSIDTFWHSILGVDASDRPLTPVITWEDTRPYEAAQELCSLLDEREIHERTGARFHASYWPAKLRWLEQEQPEIFQKAAQWISFGEYLHRQLLGHSVCSLSMASGTGLLSTRERSWDTELVQFLHVRPEQLPKLGDLSDGIQGLQADYAQRWPVLNKIPWYPAIGDGAAACVGSGCVTQDHWSLTVGTSSALRVVLPVEQVKPPDGLWLYLIDNERAVLGGALSQGGNLLTWIDQTLKLPELKEVDALVGPLTPDEHGLTLLPFISGERSLGWHANARMTIAGISIHTTPAELMRAGIEALAYQLAAVYDQLCSVVPLKGEKPQVLCSGGALFSSEVLRQVIADTMGVAIYPSPIHEASARGNALLALETLKIIPNVTQVPLQVDSAVEPDSERGALYRKGMERQKQLYQLLLPH